MKIVKNKLVSIDQYDIPENGIYINNDITEIGDNCFNEFDTLVKIICKKVTTVGNYSLSYNQALVTLELPALTTVGNYSLRSNQALVTLELPALTTVGNYSLSYNQALVTLVISKTHLNHKCVDGYPFIIENEKSTKGIKIYTGYNFDQMTNSVISKSECYVAEKDGFTAHGSTVKIAIGDLQFKIVSEKLKNDPISETTKLTVKYYRLVTGACDMGCRDFMQKNGIPFEILNAGSYNEETKEIEPITAKELLPILEKSNAYGVEKFKSLLNFI